MTVLNKLLINKDVIENLTKEMLASEYMNQLIKDSKTQEKVVVLSYDKKYSITADAYVATDEEKMFLLEVRVFDEEEDQMVNAYLELFNSDLTVYDKYVDDVWSFKDWASISNDPSSKAKYEENKNLEAAIKNIVVEYNSKKLNKDDESLTEQSLKSVVENHKECFINGEIEVVQYGNENTSVECTKCNEVVIDSDVINEEKLLNKIVYSLNGEDVLSVLDVMPDDAIKKLKELKISDKEVIDFVKYKMEIPWSEYVEVTIDSLICRMENK